MLRGVSSAHKLLSLTPGQAAHCENSLQCLHRRASQPNAVRGCAGGSYLRDCPSPAAMASVGSAIRQRSLASQQHCMLGFLPRGREVGGHLQGPMVPGLPGNISQQCTSGSALFRERPAARACSGPVLMQSQQAYWLYKVDSGSKRAGEHI